jgi:hypothetical protein
MLFWRMWLRKKNATTVELREGLRLGLAGEVHLETILKDLRERFARCELAVSPPLVAFRESVAADADAPEGAQRPARVGGAPRAAELAACRQGMCVHGAPDSPLERTGSQAALGMHHDP